MKVVLACFWWPLKLVWWLVVAALWILLLPFWVIFGDRPGEHAYWVQRGHRRAQRVSYWKA